MRDEKQSLLKKFVISIVGHDFDRTLQVKVDQKFNPTIPYFVSRSVGKFIFIIFCSFWHLFLVSESLFYCLLLRFS